MISIIVAVASNLVIGKNNDLIWHISEDLKRFKKLTLDHTVIMGKRTYESLPVKPLKNRRNIVITDDPSDAFEGSVTVTSIDQALKLCNPVEENFIMGGASIYKQFLPFADRLYLTEIQKEFEGDVSFPNIDFNEWELISKEDRSPDDENDFYYSFCVYDRKK